ncbi:replication protein [Psychrobacter sp. I-STPA6b]|uniref:replication protein n=1 Tax=Psychrobacter sp. I-STPA6b TaxID=2585718 RepID=UPI001D0CCF06|nr:replication protein [Psychrobacter sp. I-STPA6b]
MTYYKESDATTEDIQELLMDRYARIPNVVLQMQRVLKNGNVYACLQFIWIKTGSWGKGVDTIAYSQFRDDERYGTGLSVKTIQRSVEKLADLGVITMKPSFNGMYEYSINIEKITELTAQLLNKKGSQVRSNCPQGKSNSHDLKETTQVNLSSSAVNLSATQVNLSSECGQIDLHTIPITQDLLHKTNTQDSKTKKSKKEPEIKKPTDTQLANSLVDFWNENHGKSASVKHKVWVSKIKTRLKTYSVDEIKQAMLGVITSVWHQQNNQVLIKNAISSDERCSDAIARYNQAQVNKTHANNQPNHSQHQQPVKKQQSSYDEYEAMLREQFLAEFGQSTNTTANPSDSGNVFDMETNF